MPAPDHAAVMPPGWPYYRLPSAYRDVLLQLALFRADRDAAARFVPEPLAPGDGTCLLATLDVPFSSSYGPFQESFLAIACQLRADACAFIPLVFLNNPRAICAGREIYGTPKVWADVTLERHRDALLGRTRLDGATLIELETRSATPIPEERLPRLFPAYRLKVIPSADGRGAAVKQLVTAAPSDARLTDPRVGSAEVRFHAAAGLDLRALQPIGAVEGFTYRMSYLEGWGEIVYDYLAEGGGAPRSG